MRWYWWGCAFHLLRFTSSTAQNDRFGYITCTGLRVVDQEDNELIHLSTDENGGNLVVRSIDDTGRINAKGVALGIGDYGGSVSVWGDYGSSVSLGVSSHGGLILVTDKDADSLARLGVTEDGSIAVFKKAGNPLVRVDDNGHGGRIVVFSKDRKSEARLGIDQQGGRAAVFGKDGSGQAVLGIADDNGNVSIFGKDGKPRVALSVSGFGGSVAAYGVDGKPQATLGVNMRNEGGVAVFSKDGKPRAVLGSDENGGIVGVFGKTDDKTRASMHVKPSGRGVVGTSD